MNSDLKYLLVQSATKSGTIIRQRQHHGLWITVNGKRRVLIVCRQSSIDFQVSARDAESKETNWTSNMSSYKRWQGSWLHSWIFYPSWREHVNNRAENSTLFGQIKTPCFPSMRSRTVALISHSFRFVVRKYFQKEAEWMQYTLRRSYGNTILFFSLESLSREKADKLMAVTRRIEVRGREEA